jgi:proteic killer suppression protein
MPQFILASLTHTAISPQKLSLCRRDGLWSLLLTYYVKRYTMNIMIQTFRCKDTQALYEGGTPKRFRAIADVAIRRLSALDAAVEIRDLKSPPGNRLESLAGDRRGQLSVRINGQWRVCFKWTTKGPVDVEIIDYH